jgi:hypothetical protein
MSAFLERPFNEECGRDNDDSLYGGGLLRYPIVDLELLRELAMAIKSNVFRRKATVHSQLGGRKTLIMNNREAKMTVYVIMYSIGVLPACA